MADYASQTVAQLKEILKTKGLSVDGKKADLVQRLQESEATTLEVAAEEPAAPVVASTEPVAEAPAVSEAPVSAAAEVVEAEAAPASEEPVVEEPPKVLTADERKQLAVELLQKKISRAQKFGDEEAAVSAKKDLARVEKFGVELGTALAREIGLVDTSLSNGFKKFNKFRKNFKPNHKNKNRNKNNRK